MEVKNSFSEGLILKNVELYPESYPDKYELGCGSYGRVRMVKYCHTICAAKEIHYNLYNNATEEEAQQTIDKFIKECKRCSRVRHPHIVQFLGVYYPNQVDDGLPLLIMEKMDYNLDQFIKEHHNVNLQMKVSIVHDVSLGLCFLHSQNPPIVHRDLSPKNVLLTANKAKISDFGMAKIIEPGSNAVHTEAPGQHNFMPPEAFVENPNYGPPLDVFSLGGLILYVFSRHWPIPSEKAVQHGSNVAVLTEVERRQKYLDMIIGGKESEEVKVIVTNCLSNEPDKRPNVVEICKEIEKLMDAKILPSDVRRICAPQKGQIYTTDRDENEKESGSNLMSTGTDNILQENEPWKPEFMEALSSGRYTIKWAQLPDLPTPMCHAYIAQDTKKMLIFVTGECPDEDKQNLVYVYDVIAKCWDTLPPPGQYYGIPQIIDEKLVIIGGRLSTTKERTNKVSTYDKSKKKWTTYFPDMRTVRSKPGVVTYLEHVIVAGGDRDNEKGKAITLDTIEVLNWYENENWRIVSTTLPVPMYNFLPVVFREHIFIVGYSIENRRREKNAYKISIANFTSIAKQRKKHEWCQVASYICSGAALIPNFPAVLAVGGEYDSSPVAEIKFYDSSNNSWRNIGSLSSARTSIAVAKVSDTAIIVLGGCTNSESQYTSSLKTVELAQAELLY